MTNTLNFRLRKSLLLFLKIIVLDIESYTIFFFNLFAYFWLP